MNIIISKDTQFFQAISDILGNCILIDTVDEVISITKQMNRKINAIITDECSIDAKRAADSGDILAPIFVVNGSHNPRNSCLGCNGKRCIRLVKPIDYSYESYQYVCKSIMHMTMANRTRVQSDKHIYFLSTQISLLESLAYRKKHETVNKKIAANL